MKIRRNFIRFVSLVLIIAISMPVHTYALLNPTGDKSEANSDWITTSSMEARVDKFLNGNIAFVDGSKRVWNKTQCEEMEAKAEIGAKDSMYISGAYAQKLGSDLSGDMVSLNDVAKDIGYNVFYDDRGFAMLSTNANAVDYTLPKGIDWYYDYYTVAAAMGEITWETISPTDSDYDKYIENWRHMLTIPEGGEEKWVNTVKSAVKNANDLLEFVDKSSKTSPLSNTDIPQKLGSAQYIAFETVYKNLYNIALGWYMEGKTDSEKLDAVLYGINFMYENYYAPNWSNSNGTVRWTTFQFTLPYYVGNILCLLGDSISDELKTKYVNAVFDKSIDPTTYIYGTLYNAHYYTNRLWVGTAFLNCAMLVKDEYRINYVFRYLNQVFDYVSRNATVEMTNDGFYEDGSLVLHTNNAYNMGYGTGYLNAVAALLIAGEDTCFNLQKVNNYDRIYTMIENTFLPFVTRNMRMKLALGRESQHNASAVVGAMMVIADYAPDSIKADVGYAIKAVAREEYWKDYLNATPSSQWMAKPQFSEKIEPFIEYMKTLPETEFKNYNKVYYNMDRVIHERENFRFGLAMSSKRIEKYEGYTSNGYGLKDWYTGDGMTYIYTDGKQYTEEWLRNVDPYYMPGTTVDSTPRTEFDTEDEEQNGTWGSPQNDFAGGVTDGTDGAAGMILDNQYVSGLDVRKSYFMFGDEIICMGSGISGGSGDVYTVVDNRALHKKRANGSELAEISIVDMFDYKDNPIEDLQLINNGISDQTDSWRNSDLGSWIVFDFGESVKLAGPAIQFFGGDKRQQMLEFHISDDGVNFKKIFDGNSSGTTSELEFFNVPAEGRYFKIVHKGNTAANNDWITVPEIKFYPADLDPQIITETLAKPNTGAETLIINDEEIDNSDFDNAHATQSAAWAWCETGFGYVFLNKASLTAKREFTTPGHPYLKLYLDHGINPENEKYAYVIMPGATEESTKSAGENSRYEILEQTDSIHAVRDNKNNQTGAIIFENGEVEGIKFDSAAAVLIKKDGNVYKMYISDPTQTQSELKIKFPYSVKILNDMGEPDSDGTLSVKTNRSSGKTHEIDFIYTNYAEDGEIKTVDVDLIWSKFVATALWASDGSESNLTYQVIKQPENGSVSISNNILRYFPKSEEDDSILVEVRNQKNNINYIYLRIKRRGNQYEK